MRLSLDLVAFLKGLKVIRWAFLTIALNFLALGLFWLWVHFLTAG